MQFALPKLERALEVVGKPEAGQGLGLGIWFLFIMLGFGRRDVIWWCKGGSGGVNCVMWRVGGRKGEMGNN